MVKKRQRKSVKK